jgi:hypothetical protein
MGPLTQHANPHLKSHRPTSRTAKDRSSYSGEVYPFWFWNRDIITIRYADRERSRSPIRDPEAVRGRGNREMNLRIVPTDWATATIATDETLPNSNTSSRLRGQVPQ